jgi:hypothetical protein
MRCFSRRILTAAGLSAAAVLAGCSSLSSLDPTTWFDNKKPIPGERKLVFPEGVPGVPQGVPPELVQGSQPAADSALTAAAPVQGTQPAPPASASPAPAPAARAPTRPTVATRSQQRRKAQKDQARTAPAPPDQPPAQATAQPAAPQPASADSSVWGAPPGQGTSAPWPSPQPSPSTVWPDPPSSGSFSR